MRFIKKRREYLEFMTRARRFSNQICTLFFFFDGSESDVAVGITVTKKIGCAVVRNRIKRRVRAFLRSSNELSIKGIKINVVPKTCCYDINWDEFQVGMQSLFQEVGKLSPDVPVK